MNEPNLMYLFAAGVVFWAGLWLTTGWLILRVRRVEQESSSGSAAGVKSDAEV